VNGGEDWVAPPRSFAILDATSGFDGQVKDDVCPSQPEEHFLKQVLLP
jgi:hypothetical protein